MWELADLFLSLFPNRNDSLIRHVNDTAWRQVSRFHKLSDQQILECISSPTDLVRACRLDECMQFLIMRIPAASRYHDTASISVVKEALRGISVSAKHYEHLGDWYLYIFLADWIRCDVAGQLLAEWLIEQGIEVEDGVLEVLEPDSPIPLPLQKGFSWINDKGYTLVRREEISLESSLALFLADLDKTATDVDTFVNALLSRPALDFAPTESIAVDKPVLLLPPSSAGPPEFQPNGVVRQQQRPKYFTA